MFPTFPTFHAFPTFIPFFHSSVPLLPFGTCFCLLYYMMSSLFLCFLFLMFLVSEISEFLFFIFSIRKHFSFLFLFYRISCLLFVPSLPELAYSIEAFLVHCLLHSIICLDAFWLRSQVLNNVMCFYPF